MEFRDLQVFVEIAKLGGFNRAAAQLHIAQSALSRRVSLLEHQIGTPLFVRSRSGVRLTPAGMHLLKSAESLLHNFEQVRAEILSEAGEARGNVSLGFPPSLMQVANRVIGFLKGRYPHLFVRSWVATTVELRKMLVSGDLDIAVFASIENDPVITTRKLFDDSLSLVYPRDKVLPASITWNVIASLSLIMPGRPNSVRILVDDAAAKRRLSLNIVVEVNDVALLIELAKSGVGCIILPTSAVDSIDHERLSFKRIPELRLQWVVGHLKGQPLSAACLRAIETIQAVVAAQNPSES